jgi:hypothetical protein
MSHITLTTLRKLKRRISNIGKEIFELEDKIKEIEEAEFLKIDIVERTQVEIIMRNDIEKLHLASKPLFTEYKAMKAIYDEQKKLEKKLSKFYY